MATYGPAIGTKRLQLFGGITGAAINPSIDTHGSLSAFNHFHMADAATTQWEPVQAVPVPADYISGGAIIFEYSSSVGNNNLRIQIIVYESKDGDTSDTALVANTSSYAVPAAANTKKVSSQVGLGSNTAPGRFLHIDLARLGSDGNDTNTGQMSLWAVYFDYLGRL